MNAFTTAAIANARLGVAGEANPDKNIMVLLAELVEAAVGGTTGLGGTVAVLRAAGTQSNGSIAVGGTAQTIEAANLNRNTFAIQNTSLGDLYLHTSAAATYVNGFRIAPGATLNLIDLGFMPTGAISLIGATAGQTFIQITS